MILAFPLYLHRSCPTELIVVRAIGVEKCANDFIARRVRPIGRASRALARVTSFR